MNITPDRFEFVYKENYRMIASLKQDARVQTLLNETRKTDYDIINHEGTRYWIGTSNRPSPPPPLWDTTPLNLFN
uniref:Uncharacterized protein n=1 Tax=viral metagenome TaxID=1070528 RepID=A0A6C0DBS7_9ZZZZ